ncbi:MAG: hypothetical protein U5R31_07300 [Acidimicrobiia bacterium]|nr:hypothetical protein [Acidimicrobiia bacterium]
MSVKGTYRRLVGAAPGAPGAELSTAGIRRSVAGSVVGKGAEMVTLVLLATLVPRALGPADFGRFSVVLTVVTIGALAMTLGGPTLMARFVPSAELDRRVAVARAIGGRLAKGRAVQLVAIAVLAAALVIVAPEHFPPALLAAVVVALALNVAATLALQVVLGLGRTGPWSARFPLQNAVVIVVVLALHPALGQPAGPLAVLAASVVAAGFGIATAWPVLTTPTPAVPVPDGAVRFGAYQAGGAALTQFAQRGGVLAVALLAGSQVETGFAALAIGIALGATYAVLQAFTVSLPHLASRRPDAAGGDPGVPERAWLPHRRRLTADPEIERAEAVLRRFAGALVAVLVPGALAGVLLLEPLVPVVFGEEFEGAVAAFGPALALVVLAPLNALGVQSTAMRLRPEVALATGLAWAVGFLVVAAATVPVWGAVGGTAAALAGGVAGAVSTLWFLPGAVGARLASASLAGTALVFAAAVVAT